MNHLIKTPESLATVREQFNKVKQEAFERDPTLADKPLNQMLDELVTVDNVQTLDFLDWVIKEALRVETPVQSSSHFEILEDLTAGKFHFKKGDLIMPAFFALHHNSKYW